MGIIRMWHVIRLADISDGVLILRGVSACADDGAVETLYDDDICVSDPSTIRIERGALTVTVRFDGTLLVADEVEDGREDRFHPVWYRPICGGDDE